MNWNYAYTPYIWPPFFTVLLLISLSIYSGRRRSVPGALLFTVACLFAALWAASSVMEYAAVDLETKIIWIKLQSFWQPPLVAVVTCFLLEYTWPGRWLSRRNLALFSIPPFLINAMIITDNLHHLAWRNLTFNNMIQPQVGLVGWIAYAYAFLILGTLNLLVFGWLFLHSPLQRWPVSLMLVGQFGGRIFYMLERTGNLHSILPIDVLGMGFEFLMYAIALFGFRLFDPIPLARQTAIEQFQDGILVLDPQERVASLNPAAKRMLGVSTQHAQGRLVRELLPAWSDEHLDDTNRTVIEFSLGEGPAVRDYTMGISQMKDWRGLEVGRLLLLRDVTDPKRARELQKQQQLLLAVMQERELLAREMHDSLGQTLAAAHLQASTARLLLAQGDTAQTEKILRQIAEITIAAEADVREYLLGAKTVLSSNHLFFPTLRQYVDRFSQQYGLQVDLCIPAQLEEQGLGTVVEVQLLRIIQEALSNVRKHARANNVQVIFTVSELLVQIVIIDDGQGFDSESIAAQQAEGFGLQAMRERAETLGGCLEVISQPGQGTQVMVQVQMDKGVKG